MRLQRKSITLTSCLSVPPLFKILLDRLHVLRCDVLILLEPLLLVDMPNGDQLIAPPISPPSVDRSNAHVDRAVLGDEVVVMDQAQSAPKWRSDPEPGDVDARPARGGSSEDRSEIQLVRRIVPVLHELVRKVEDKRRPTFHWEHHRFDGQGKADLLVDPRRQGWTLAFVSLPILQDMDPSSARGSPLN